MNILGRADRAAEISSLAWIRLSVAHSLPRAISLVPRTLPTLTGLRQVLPPGRDVLKALVVGVAYYLGAELAFWIGTLSYFFAPLWPPNMILFAALLQAPYRSWWIYVAAAFPAHVAAETGMGMQTLPLLGAFACNVTLALISAAGLRRLSAVPPWMDSLAKAWTFIVVAAVGAPLLVASGIAALGWLTDGEIGGRMFAARWGTANILGGIALAPIFVTWIGEGLHWLRQISAWRAVEATFLAAALAVSAYIGFPAASAEYPVLACVPVPLMLWAAVRFGPRGASGAILVVSLMALAGAIEGHAPFLAASPEHTILSLQMFLAVLAAPFLVLSGLVVERARAAADVELAHEELRSILDHTPAFVYVKDRQGRFTYANRRARALLQDNFLGRRTIDLLPARIATALMAEDELVMGNGRPIIKEEVLNRGMGARSYLTTKFPLKDPGGQTYGVCIISTDISELKRAQQEVHDLSARLLNAQDEERRRIARELHDSTAQTLTALVLNLNRLLRNGKLDEDARAITNESMTLANEMHSEMRTLSYLLHPPLLDELGLASALTWYVDGFTKRSGIAVRLSVSPNIGRVDANIEMALFRVVQESLGNVHRHSGSKTAEIRLERTSDQLVLSISDSGRGFSMSSGIGSQLQSLGVGIAGMKARLEQLGGKLDIRSSSSGTTVSAMIPTGVAEGASPAR
jgi:two-component system, NarL family, sensor kinase